MGLSPNGVLKISLWLQAGSLLVLTSLLANVGAWIGAALTAIGICFVVIGLGAAHKRSLGYLYCYATLIGVWTLLVVAHVIIILGGITVLNELMDPVLVVGQKIVDNHSDVMKIIVPALYGVQSIAWCASLMCLVSLRMGVRDLTLGFEIQSPKRKSGTHSLNPAQGNKDGSKRGNRMSQRFLGLGQSMVAPLENNTETSETQEREKARGPLDIQRGQCHEKQSSGYKMEEPRMSWISEERRISNDSSVIYVPGGRRISQVVVTFRDDGIDARDAVSSHPSAELKSGPSKEGVIIARTAFINHNYGLGDLVFDKPGESLSDIIFKVVKPMQDTSVSKDFDGVSDSEYTDSNTDANSPTLSTVTTMDDFDMNAQDDEQELVAKDLDATTDSTCNPFDGWSYSKAPRQIEDERGQESGTFAGAPMKWPSTRPPVPARRSSFSHHILAGVQSEPSSTAVMGAIRETGEKDWADSNTESGDHDPYSHIDTIPRVQPNSSNTHPYLINSSVPSVEATGDDATHSAAASKPRAELPSRQYWRARNDTNDAEAYFDSDSFSFVSNILTSPTSSSSPAKTGSRTKIQPAISTPTLTTPQFTIPTIVLHPDEEDNEPVRVLSDMDIEYLSTMPPVPLRLLIQPWDEVNEEEYYEEDINDGYDYDDYHPRYEQYPDEMNYDDYEEEDIQREIDLLQEAVQSGSIVETIYDPYALDVPINLAIDLQGLEQGDIKVGHGYV
ncbi:hypothetical protein BC939DRAFT_65533 [Gamsiella multidivaricata]|uniref:uncharacterized protein n=1 Tax=Gamsiella multidivaricata TaxID=101098 RepID=UPI0022210B12|nr:uncharacterized protein BC939DRAFT_65533 [Gamsiella multidivaricata]KAG0366045.1 hypothetical protein BGZ54_005880 [Gamsiella multidivaricata]KAI7816103.1 hypothetical protein BC939DRAFT_65533 [Gamsiella multidivaricata]